MKESAVENGLSIISKSLTRLASKRPELNTDEQINDWVQSVMARIGTTTDSVEGVEKADLVVEVSPYASFALARSADHGSASSGEGPPNHSES